MKLVVERSGKVRGNRRAAVSPVIATLLLIAIAVAAAIIVYAFVTGLIGGLTTGGGSNLVTVSGNILAPTGTTTGTLVVNIKNSANNPITGIIATYPTGAASFTGAGGITANCMGQSTADVVCAAGAVKFQFKGADIQTSNPLPVGSETSAVDTITQQVAGALSSGRAYSISITVTFATGSPQTQLVSITAQL
jgi:flagellin-like protein